MSPCDGDVVDARNALLNNSPGDPDTDQPEGNYLVLKCAETEVFLGHLQRGSATVARGAAVGAQQPIARVGHSGNSLEPHLHIEARQNGAMLGLEFQGRTLSVNSLLQKRAQVGRLSNDRMSPLKHHDPVTWPA